MTASESTPISEGRYANPTYRWYAVAVMMGIYMSHAMDRSMAGILIEPIKNEFALTDAQVGLYSGSAFGLAFALSVLPMGYLSDRVSRRNLLVVMVTAWSLFTALGGLSRSYMQLLLTRVGVGIFEAGAAPAALPMLSDIFPANRRGFVMGIFYTSSNLGAMLAAAAGGLIAATYGWRIALMLAGVPGLVFAIIMLTTVQEPRRGRAEPGDTSEVVKAAPLGEVCKFLVRNPAIIALMIGAALMALITVTMTAWAASFFIRVHHFSLAQVGLIIGLAGGTAGIFSPPLFGWLGDRLATRNAAWALRIVWISAIMALASGMIMLFTPHVAVAALAYGAGEFLRSGYPPTTYSVLMAKTPVQMRGTIVSMVQLASYLMGFGLGPVLVGALSDFYGGGTAIRFALANALLIYVPVIVLYMVAARGLFGGRAPGHLNELEDRPVVASSKRRRSSGAGNSPLSGRP